MENRLPEGRNWIATFHKCPKCGGEMILNKKHHECSERDCDYIEGMDVKIHTGLEPGKKNKIRVF